MIGCDPNTYRGKQLGRIVYRKPGKRQQTTLQLPPKTRIGLYENYTHKNGPGNVWIPEDCFRLRVTIEQAATKKKLECYPFGGTKSKWYRSTSCRSGSRVGGTYRKKVCRINDCKASLPAGGKTTISAKLVKLKPCSRTVTAHTVIIMKLDN